MTYVIQILLLLSPFCVCQNKVCNRKTTLLDVTLEGAFVVNKERVERKKEREEGIECKAIRIRTGKKAYKIKP